MDEYSSSSSRFCIRASSSSLSRGGGGGTGTKCGRWNPTSEQVKVLTDLFMSGLRTPSTDQIQNISSQLSLYGKIESKNVFYWFQNHKARERQYSLNNKRRRSTTTVFVVDHQQQPNPNHHFHHHIHTTTTTIPIRDTPDVPAEAETTEKVTETLELFPLRLKEVDSISADYNNNNNKVMSRRLFSDHNCKENNMHVHVRCNEMDHPTLDLRLSFV